MSANDKIEVIAIDGPAGSGKSTVAQATARRLDWNYIDTGAMYRCLCLYALQHGIEMDELDQLIEALDDLDLDMYFEDGTFTVLMNGEDVSEEIRKNEVSKRVSQMAAQQPLRERLVELQRELGKDGQAVVEGRDIGTVVFPDARYKFYLDAPLEVRARRRYNQLEESGQSDVNYESVVEEIRERDRSDKDRDAGPLKPPEDAQIVNTADQTVDEVVNRLVQTLGTNSKSSR